MTPVSKSQKSGALVWLVVALTLASVLLLGYNLGEVNHFEQLPPILRALDLNYLRVDWIVNANQGFNHRWFYTTLMALCARVLSVEGAFFAVYLASLVAWTTGICALVKAIWPDGDDTTDSDSASSNIAAVVAPLFLLFSTWGTISNLLVFNNLLPALISLAFVVWFGVMIGREKFAFAALLLLASGLMHAQIGPLSGIFLLGAQIYALDKNLAERRRVLRFFPLWILGIAVPIGLALISDDKRPLNPAQSREALDVLTFLRHPHHYIPQSWTRDAWLSEIAWLLLILLARAIAKPARFVDGILGATLLFCLGGWIPFVSESLFPLVKLQHFRMSIWLQIAGSIYLSRVVALWLRGDSAPHRIAGAIVFAAIMMPLITSASGAYRLLLPLSLGAFWLVSRRAVSSNSTFNSDSRRAYFSLLLLAPWIPFWVSGRADSPHFNLKIVLTALFALLILALLRLWQRSPQLAPRVYRGAAFGAALLLLGLFLRPPTGRLARFNRVKTRIAYPNPDGPMQQWVKSNTPSDAIFLIPLTLDSFRLKANRAVVVDFKVFPWSDAGLLDWRRRIDAVLGASLPLDHYTLPILEARYDNLNAAHLENTARRYSASYLVTKASASGDFSRFSRVYADPKWRIFRINSS